MHNIRSWCEHVKEHWFTEQCILWCFYWYRSLHLSILHFLSILYYHLYCMSLIFRSWILHSTKLMCIGINVIFMHSLAVSILPTISSFYIMNYPENHDVWWPRESSRLCSRHFEITSHTIWGTRRNWGITETQDMCSVRPGPLIIII